MPPTWTMPADKHDRSFCGSLGDDLLSQPDGGFSIIHEHVDDDWVRLTIPAGLITKAEFDAYVLAYTPSDD